MAKQKRNKLKQYFKKGNKPKQEEYEHLIDSFVNHLDDNIIDKIPDASATKKGKVELATIAEAKAGTDKVRAVTPEGVKNTIEVFAPVKSVNGKTGDVVLNLDSEDSGWKAAPLKDGITQYSTSYQSARYRKKNGVVYIEGMIKGGTATNELVLFTLPSGYRPTKRLILNTYRSNGIQRTDVEKNGNVRCYKYNPGWTSISGISFLVD